MTPSYPVLTAAIRARLDRDWVTPRQLAERLQLWEVGTVRHALRIMADRGECETKSKKLRAPLDSTSLYRAKQSTSVTA